MSNNTSSERALIEDAINAYFHQSVRELERGDLGDIEKRNWETIRDKCKALLSSRSEQVDNSREDLGAEASNTDEASVSTIRSSSASQSSRETAMEWWESLLPLTRQDMSTKFYGRNWAYLTGREIEVIHDKLKSQPKPSTAPTHIEEFREWLSYQMNVLDPLKSHTAAGIYTALLSVHHKFESVFNQGTGSSEAGMVKVTLHDLVAAAQYGLKYATESMHDGEVPDGNVLQWYWNYKNLPLDFRLREMYNSEQTDAVSDTTMLNSSTASQVPNTLPCSEQMQGEEFATVSLELAEGKKRALEVFNNRLIENSKDYGARMDKLYGFEEGWDAAIQELNNNSTALKTITY